MSILAEEKGEGDWIKLDLHLHTLDDPKDVIDYSAHQLLDGRDSSAFAFSPSRYTTLSLIAWKSSRTPPPWEFCSFRRRKFVYKAPM